MLVGLSVSKLMPGDSARFNGKKGGRPKGKKSQATLEKEAVLAAYRQRVLSFTDTLLNAQLTLARGMTYLYKITKKNIGTARNPRYVNEKPALVTSQVEIEAYLEKQIEEGDMYDEKDPAATYYFLTTKDPDGSAIDSMMNRTFGKAVQALVTKDPDGHDAPIGGIVINAPIKTTGDRSNRKTVRGVAGTQ